MAEETTNATVQTLERPTPVDRVVEKAREGLGTAKEKLHAVGGEVNKQYEKLSADVRRGAERASKVAKESFDETSDTLRTGYTKVRKDLDGLMTDVNVYVRDNPGKSVLIAAGVGFLIGLVSRGRGGHDAD